jgi:pyruvate dehydrogenase E1 component alpha subunit/2-oxoisovalerate dehydrogenase E1 component
MNLASLWKLPVLFVCENNRYAMGTRLDFSHSVTDLSKKAAGYCVPASAVDGMDVLAVEEAATSAAEFVRSGKGPYFLECRTYRFRAHSMYDPELYRDKAEVEEWKKRDPIPALLRRIDDEDLAELERDVTKEIDDAIAFAEAGTWEAAEDLLRSVYSETSA